MKILGQIMLQAYQTKKKLSNSKHVHWVIALVVAIGLGYLFILIEFVKMHDRKILFYNLKTSNLEKENALQKNEKNPAVFNNNSPLFVIYKDKIVFGTVQSIVLPKLKKDSLILDRTQFSNDFKEKILSYKNKKDLFPAKVVGISFQNSQEYNKQIMMMNEVFSLIKEENSKAEESEGDESSVSHGINPSLVFVDTLPVQ